MLQQLVLCFFALLTVMGWTLMTVLDSKPEERMPGKSTSIVNEQSIPKPVPDVNGASTTSTGASPLSIQQHNQKQHDQQQQQSQQQKQQQEKKLPPQLLQPIMHASPQSLPQIGELLGTQTSKNAYVTLIHGIDNTFSYRGYLYNCLIMRSVLQRLGSTADFIALLGFTTDGDFVDYPQFVTDFTYLSQLGIRLYFLPRLRPEKKRVSFAEMALLKISPWNFTTYNKVQFLDGDVLPTKSLDCYFGLDKNAFNTGNASPLNSGWYVGIPNSALYQKMRADAVARLNTPWDENTGWGTVMPKGVAFRNGGKPVVKWNFNGASLDQGLLFHTLCLNDGSVVMLDHQQAINYLPGYQKQLVDLKQTLSMCDGKSPMEKFIHFTGRNKPWLQKDLGKTKDKNLLLWKTELDALRVGSISSQNYTLLGTKIPLGLFHPNK